MTFPVVIVPLDAQTLHIGGNPPLTLKMTDYGIQPPAPVIAGMPTSQTGDEIRVTFAWDVRRQAQ